MKQKISHTKNTVEFSLSSLATPGHWVLPWSVVDGSSDTQLEKTSVLFARVYQLQVASWLGVGTMFTCPDSAGTLLGLNLCWSCVFCHTLGI